MSICNRPHCQGEAFRWGMCYSHYTKRTKSGHHRRVPREPVVNHLRTLREHYQWSWPELAERSGVSEGTLKAIWRGFRDGQQQHAVQRNIAMTLLAMPLTFSPSARVDKTGFVRRAQALARIGWPLREQSRMLGWQESTLSYHIHSSRPYIYRRTHEAMVELYDKLCMTPGDNQQAISYAKKNKWASPLAWDEDERNIDDPNAKPYNSYSRRRVAGNYVRLSADEAREHMNRLRDRGWSFMGMAIYIGLPETTLRNIYYRRQYIRDDRHELIMSIPLREPPEGLPRQRRGRRDRAYQMQRQMAAQLRAYHEEAPACDAKTT